MNKKAAAGSDGIDNNILYKLRDIIADPLSRIFQCSFDNGKYLWKKQHVIPVHKPGKNKSKAESYRPISLTSQIGKLLERIVLDEMLDFLKRNNLLSDN